MSKAEAEKSAPPAEQKQQQAPAILVEDAAGDEPGETSACLQQEQQQQEEEEAVEGEKKKTGTLGRFRIPKGPQIRGPKVAGQRVTLERNAEKLDVVSRDPNGLNSHCKIQFEDIIAEPDETVFSFDSVWTLSFKVFTVTKLWCYRITSLICAIPAAICWGIQFAMLSFCTIWCWQPSIKSIDISLWYVRSIYEIVLKVFFEPCFHAMGKCFSHVVVNIRREA